MINYPGSHKIHGLGILFAYMYHKNQANVEEMLRICEPSTFVPSMYSA